MVVDFPAPFGPRKPHTSPLVDVERDAIDGDEVLVALRRFFVWIITSELGMPILLCARRSR